MSGRPPATASQYSAALKMPCLEGGSFVSGARMDWTMTVCAGVKSLVAKFDEPAVAWFMGLSAVEPATARDRLFGRKDEVGFWRVITAEETRSAFAPLLAQKEMPPAVSRELKRLEKFVARLPAATSVWIGVG